MRYRVGEEAATAALNSTHHSLVLTVVMSLIVGIVLVWLGRHGRQMWLIAWSWGLILCSIAYGGLMLFGLY
jgi:hypothetical protein